MQLSGADSDAVSGFAASVEATELMEPESVLNFTNVRVNVRASKLAEVAQRSDVVWIEPYQTPELLDERQGLILAGSFSGNRLTHTNYLTWLNSKGISSTPDFLVDVADSGIDKGISRPRGDSQRFLK